MEKNNYDIKVGFSRLDITPPLGVNIVGYFKVRIADGILDALEVNAVAVGKCGETAVILTVDNCSASTAYLEKAAEMISERCKISRDAVFIHSTHTHTGPRLAAEQKLEFDLEKEYARLTLRKLSDAAFLAIADMKPARMGYAFSKAERVGFNRRYLMKDGSIKTNPGVGNPEIERSVGMLDERVNVLRFEREDGTNIVIANYGNHPDTIGGNKISADWPGQTRRIFEKAVDNCKCVVINGAQGDVNHVNVHPINGDLNGMFIDFDDVSRGYSHTKHIGNVVAGAVMQVYEKVNFVSTESIRHLQRTISLPSNMPKPEDMEQAHYINDMHREGKDSELPYKGMLLTTFVAEAERMVRLENGPDSFSMKLSALSIGGIVFIGIPGEPFTGIGMSLKQAQGWNMVLPCCLTNGSEGYFPMQDSYDEGGYEARSSIFKAGVAELIIKEGTELLNQLR